MTTVYIFAKNIEDARKIAETRWPGFKISVRQYGERWEVTLNGD